MEKNQEKSLLPQIAKALPKSDFTGTLLIGKIDAIDFRKAGKNDEAEWGSEFYLNITEFVTVLKDDGEGNFISTPKRNMLTVKIPLDSNKQIKDKSQFFTNQIGKQYLFQIDLVATKDKGKEAFLTCVDYCEIS